MGYPYIGKGLESGSIVLFYEQNTGVTLNSKTWASKSFEYSNCINEDSFENITSEYLSNTYGKIESKEHARLIAKLAEGAGIKFAGVDVSAENIKSFIFYSDGTFCFYKKDADELVHVREREQVTIPLPPKEFIGASINSSEPVAKTFETLGYTSEGGVYFKSKIKEREWPVVGDKVLTASEQKGQVIAIDSEEAWIKYENTSIGKGYASVSIATLSKPKTPEEELRDDIAVYLCDKYNFITGAEALEITDTLISKYNITKKPQ